VDRIAPQIALGRYSPEVTNNLSRIGLALGRINGADIWPASAEALRFSAQVGTIHYSTLIEGNRLGLLEAERAARGELDPTTKAEIELVNYVDALAFLDRRLAQDGLGITEDLLLKVHYEATKGLGTEDGPFKPHHEGAWRDGEAGVWDPVSQRIVHAGAPQVEVRPRMLGLVDWVNAKLQTPIEWPAPVVAGLLHFFIADIHPFADGNGRTARLMTAALLMKTGQVPGRMFNFDAYYGTDKAAYLDALRSPRRETLSLESWVRYFTNGLALEYERVAGEVDRLGGLGRTAGGERLQLSSNQQSGVSRLALRHIAEFDRRDYERAANVSTTTATKDLRRLAEAGVLIRVGAGPSTRYRFVTAAAVNPWIAKRAGRPRLWTDERIEAELRVLVGERRTFPTTAAFDDAGQQALYAAVHRHGGTSEWARRLGIEPPTAGSPGSP
jgi:Fic family protein